MYNSNQEESWPARKFLVTEFIANVNKLDLHNEKRPAKQNVVWDNLSVPFLNSLAISQHEELEIQVCFLKCRFEGKKS